MSRFSQRTGWDTGESSFAATVRQARAAAERDGRRIVDLTVSNPTQCGFAYHAEALLAPLKDDRALVYQPEPRGLASAREAVSAYYAGHGASVGVDDLILTTSTSEAYSFLFRLLCDAGDEVLVPLPSYPLFDFLADLDDVRLKSYPLFYDHGWWIDRARLEGAITERTRAVMVVHPNNPTGHWTGAEERAWLEELCARRGLALMVDEVFLDYPLGEGGAGRSFAASDPAALTFVLSGLSKIAGLPQMKAAWIAVMGPEREKSEALARLEVIADTFLSMNAPVQLAMSNWLNKAGGIQTQIRERAGRNYAALRRLAVENPERLQLLNADAGWSAAIDLHGRDDGDLAEWLVRERGVVAHPGGFYGMAERSRIVVSLIVPEAELEEGMRRAVEID